MSKRRLPLPVVGLVNAVSDMSSDGLFMTVGLFRDDLGSGLS